MAAKLESMKPRAVRSRINPSTEESNEPLYDTSLFCFVNPDRYDENKVDLPLPPLVLYKEDESRFYPNHLVKRSHNFDPYSM